MGVANTGMIVGHAALPDNETIHAFAWTASSSMVDIGTLAMDPNYSHYSFSLAVNVNKSGTLIVGWSNSEFGVGINSLPVVWTPKVVWSSHEPTFIWEIHKLDTTGFEQATYWTATMVNDFGQIIGTASTSDGLDSAFLWNPVPGGKGWKIIQLPTLSPYSYAYANDINDRGEIVGYTTDWENSSFPTLWKPEGPRRNAYNLTLLTTLTGSEQGWAEANGINDRGDIVGDDWSSGTATRWSTRDPSFIEVLGFPGTWSWAEKVNNNRIAVGAYGSDTIPENIAAVQFPSK
jgi:probable HAF family extracellular repeat protein